VAVAHAKPAVPAGRSRLRAAVLKALNLSLDAVVHCSGALKAHTQATAADELHDRYLARGRRHLTAASRALEIGDTVSAAKHLEAAAICCQEAEKYDGIEDGFIRAMVGLIVKVRDALRLRNGLLDGLLSTRKRTRNHAAQQPALLED
jgi:hypothetical protein